MTRLIISLILILIVPSAWAVDATFIEIDGERYGAQADEFGPIGGGEGYARIVTEGDYTARNLEELIDALSKAKEGEVVFIPDEVEIDCTTLVYIEELVLEIPGGVTLAGNRGHEGSEGALILSDALKTRPLIRALGPKVRVTGLRIRGPNAKQYLDHHRRAFAEGRGHSYYYKFPTSVGIWTEHPKLKVDNCDISAFSHSGVQLSRGDGHHVHHNFIHHCQYHGLGYGVTIDRAEALIERNLFNFNRHSIAGTGRPGGGYEARHNVELGTASSHCFDMHGGRDRRDGTDIAGTSIIIHHNTFRAPQTPIVIRGVPEESCKVFRNWFPRHATPEAAVRGHDRTHVYDNAYGTDPARSSNDPVG